MTWRWPWVSRDLYALACIERDAARAAGVQMAEMWAAEAGRWRSAHDDLLSRYHALKLHGFAEIPAPTITPLPERDPVMLAVNQACAGKDIRVRKAMLEQVAIDRAAQKTDADIVANILRGSRPAEDVA